MRSKKEKYSKKVHFESIRNWKNGNPFHLTNNVYHVVIIGIDTMAANISFLGVYTQHKLIICDI